MQVNVKVWNNIAARKIVKLYVYSVCKIDDMNEDQVGVGLLQIRICVCLILKLCSVISSIALPPQYY